MPVLLAQWFIVMYKVCILTPSECCRVGPLRPALRADQARVGTLSCGPVRKKTKAANDQASAKDKVLSTEVDAACLAGVVALTRDRVLSMAMGKQLQVQRITVGAVEQVL